jgi:hypothetical protein
MVLLFCRFFLLLFLFSLCFLWLTIFLVVFGLLLYWRLSCASFFFLFFGLCSHNRLLMVVFITLNQLLMVLLLSQHLAGTKPHFLAVLVSLIVRVIFDPFSTIFKTPLSLYLSCFRNFPFPSLVKKKIHCVVSVPCNDCSC